MIEMNLTKCKMAIYLSLCIAIHLSVSGYPVTNPENVSKHEKQYPNGTVVGKYSYTDNEGNPIHVKYFADDASYGVELKSVKVLNSNLNSLQLEEPSKYPSQVNDDQSELVLDPFAVFKDFNKSMTDNQNVRKGSTKKSSKDVSNNNADYETFMQNELNAPERCGKEKVKVYFDKDKRKTRNVGKRGDSLELYCNRF